MFKILVLLFGFFIKKRTTLMCFLNKAISANYQFKSNVHNPRTSECIYALKNAFYTIFSFLA